MKLIQKFDTTFFSDTVYIYRARHRIYRKHEFGRLSWTVAFSI